jgi:hypothetical protein
MYHVVAVNVARFFVCVMCAIVFHKTVHESFKVGPLNASRLIQHGGVWKVRVIHFNTLLPPAIRRQDNKSIRSPEAGDYVAEGK